MQCKFMCERSTAAHPHESEGLTLVMGQSGSIEPLSCCGDRRASNTAGYTWGSTGSAAPAEHSGAVIVGGVFVLSGAFLSRLWATRNEERRGCVLAIAGHGSGDRGGLWAGSADLAFSGKNNWSLSAGDYVFGECFHFLVFFLFTACKRARCG